MQLLLILAVAVGSWIYVPGGTWQPTAIEVADAKTKLRPYVLAQSKRRNDKISPWNAYTFQYQGREIDGRKIIYVNASCSEPPEYAAQEMVFVLDGGTCYFQAYYDIQTRAFVGIGFNGLAGMPPNNSFKPNPLRGLA